MRFFSKIKVRAFILLLGLLCAPYQAQALLLVNPVVPNPANVGQTVTISGTALCIDVIINFGDGTSATVIPDTLNQDIYTATKTYSAPGSYTIQLNGQFCQTLQDTASTNVTVVASAQQQQATGLQIDRLEVNFAANNSNNITVPRGESKLGAYVDIKYRGHGLLQGFWQNDNRIVAYENRYLSTGRSIRLQMPSHVNLMTSETGPHEVRFVITNASPGQPRLVGTAMYFVRANAIGTLQLLAPAAQVQLEIGQDWLFRWSTVIAKHYFFEVFLVDDQAKPVFSAYTRLADYQLPELAQRDFFKPGQSYLWQVSAFDERRQMVAKSEQREFVTVGIEDTVADELLLTLRKPVNESALKALAKQHRLKLLERFELKSVGLSVFRYTVSAQKKNDIIRALRQTQWVNSVQHNHIYTTHAEPYAAQQSAQQRYGINKVQSKYSGKGIKIAVIDNAVDSDHKDLAANILNASTTKQYDFVGEREGSKAYLQGEIHGTAIAGIIAAAKNNFGIAGVAPAAKLLALRACYQQYPRKPKSVCFSHGISKALDQALLSKVSIINMSFGTLQQDPLAEVLIKQAARKGVLLVAAAGNNPHLTKPAFPARMPQVLAVAGTDEQGHRVPNEQVAGQADVVAPLVQFFTSVPDDRHNFISGTSMSTAFVSGVLALALEKQNRLQELPEFDGSFCDWLNLLMRHNYCRG